MGCSRCSTRGSDDHPTFIYTVCALFCLPEQYRDPLHNCYRQVVGQLPGDIGRSHHRQCIDTIRQCLCIEKKDVLVLLAHLLATLRQQVILRPLDINPLYLKGWTGERKTDAKYTHNSQTQHSQYALPQASTTRLVLPAAPRNVRAGSHARQWLRNAHASGGSGFACHSQAAPREPRSSI